MKIGSTPREHAIQALERHQLMALCQGNDELAGQISKDLAVLGQSRGDTVLEMYRDGIARTKRSRSDAGGGLGAGMVVGVVGPLTVGVMGVAIARVTGFQSVLGLIGGVILGHTLVSIGTNLVDQQREKSEKLGDQIKKALDRSAPLLRSDLTGASSHLPIISRAEVEEYLRNDGKLLSDEGKLSQAAALEEAVERLGRHQEMDLGDLLAWAVSAGNAPTADSLRQLFSNRLAAEEIKQLMTKTVDPAAIQWLEEEVSIGDQTLSRLS